MSTSLTSKSVGGLAYREAGAGIPVVLVHAFPVDGRIYDTMLSAAETGRLAARLVAVDLPGFGRSVLPEPAPDVLSVELIAEALADFIEREGLAPAVVGGVAIGGYSGIELARTRPDLVRGLVIVGCKAAPDSPSMAVRREQVAQKASSEGSTAIADELHAQPLGPQADGAVKQKMHEMISAADPRGIAALIRGIARRPDPAPTLPHVRVPALVIAGEADPFSPLDQARQVADLLPDAEFVMIRGIGHIAPLEAPVAVTRALSAFVDRLRNQSRGEQA